MNRSSNRARQALAALGAFCVSIPQLASAQETPAPPPTAQEAPAPPPDAPAPSPPDPTPPATAPADDVAAEGAADEAAAEAAVEAAAAAVAAEVDLEASAQIEEYKLNLYGFADFAYSHELTQSSFSARQTAAFSVGNLNLYVGSELGNGTRWLSEVRFMYLPHGSVPYDPTFEGPPTAPTDTTVADYADLQNAVRWGGISIQRAYVEHTFMSWLTVRAGQFLTPYGIWNVDHGSPVIISIRRPYMIGGALFPQQQTGLELYGGGLVGPVELGYHVTLSNGRGPIDAYSDLDHNKAIGARTYVRAHADALGTLTFGVSGYRGKYTQRRDERSFAENGGLQLSSPVAAQYDELALAADLKWERKGLLVQSEALMNERAYSDSVRPVAISLTGSPPGRTPDHQRGGFYVLGGYRFPFLGAMPYAGGELYSFGKQAVFPTVAGAYGGLNVRPIARLVLKAQYTHVYFPAAPTIGDRPNPLNLLDFQAAWSF